ncbi:hypothetical protein CF327_g1740 [Tilletia walkeri]|nr:hypothetical protein CF327_g1740 [Tilletia walkeri]
MRFPSILALQALLIASASASASASRAEDSSDSLSPLQRRAADPALRTLSHANWTEQISKGAWLINFCTPTSSKCGEFERVWTELQKQKESLSTSYPAAPLTLAKVDCIADTALCRDVSSVPDLTLYLDGQKQKDRFQGLREYVQLSDWIESLAQNYRKSKKVSDVPPAQQQQQQPAGLPPAAQPSPQVAPAPQPQPAPAPAAPAPPAAPQKPAPVAGPEVPNAKGELMKFGSAQISDLAALNRYLGEGSRHGSSFVKFYAPWCPHCRAMAPAFEKLATELKGHVTVIEVDCEKYADVCRGYAVASFPTLKMFNNGEVTEYTGGRNLDAMKSWAQKAGSSSGVQEIQDMIELEEIVHRRDVVFLYLVESGVKKADRSLVEKASRILLTTQAQFLQTSSPALLRKYASYLLASDPNAKQGDSQNTRSAILVFKDRSASQPVKTFYPGRIAFTLSGGVQQHLQTGIQAQFSQQVVDWLNANRYPTLSEITGTNFGDVIHNKQAALVVLASLSDIHHGGVIAATGSGAHLRDAEEGALLQLARKWRLQENIRGSPVDGEMKEDGAGAKKGKKGKKGRSRKVIWAWIDADRWAKALKEYYGIRPEDLPSLVLVDGSKLEYFRLPTNHTALDGKSWLDVQPALGVGKGSTSSGSHPVFDTIYSALRGEIKASSSRTYVDRSMRGAEQTFSIIVDWTVRHPLLSSAFVLAVLALLISYVRAVEGGGAPGAGSWARSLAGGGQEASNGASLPHYHSANKAD